MSSGFINPALGSSPRFTRLLVGDGSVAAPSFAFASDVTTGIFRSGASEIKIVTGGVSALTLDASQNAVFAGRVQIGASSALQWVGRSAIFSTADGNVLLQNAAGSTFGRLQFGGTSNTFPALKRTGVDLRLVKADDSGETSLVLSQVYATGNIYNFGTIGTLFIRSGAGSPEGSVVAEVGSLYLRTNGGAGTTLYIKESGSGNTGWVAK